MTIFKLISRTIVHFRSSAVATAAGIAITTAVICGALVIGDSLRGSLLKIVDDRLGNITHTITAGDRIFTQNLGQRLNRNDSLHASPVLKSEAIAMVQGVEMWNNGESLRVNKVQVWGIDSSFCNITGADQLLFSFSEEDDAIISKNLAVRLNLTPGDFFMVSIKRIGDIPSDTPFVTEDGQTISRRVRVKAIADNDNLGHFGMRATQSSPYNVFVNIKWLAKITEQTGMANMVILKSIASLQTDQLKSIVRSSIVPEDLGLKVLSIKNTGDIRISSRRVFIDDTLCNRLKTLFPQAEFNLTYFVNKIGNKEQQTPYSFVSAIDSTSMQLAADEIIVNKWLADDLGIVKGDSLRLNYFVFGQLRSLEERAIFLKVAGIISMHNSPKDSILMPELPGLTDAGNCRDWDTGIPVNLDNIRPKDEDYWNKFKGTPKAYISLKLGTQLWQNRFGSLTSVIIPANTSNINKLDNIGKFKNIANLKSIDLVKKMISENSDPFSLEFKVNEVRKEGIAAAQQSEDFGQLFAGLGFFIIISGLLLTILLHNLSLKIRQDQLNLFSSLGFSRALIRKIVMAEFFVISVCGACAGVLLSIGYSKLILMGLNHLWYDIVRTDSLSLHFNALTLAVGFMASVLLGMAVVFFGTSKQSVRTGSFPFKKGELRAGSKNSVSKNISVSKYLAAVLLFLSIIIIIYLSANLQSSNTFKWFGAGTLLLLSFLSGAYSFLYSDEKKPLGKITIGRLSLKNLKRNPIRSFTIIVMLALGSFVIVVTGANRKGHTDSSLDKTNGTGGFMYMAESTIPIMRNLNNPDTRLEYGIPEGVNFVQFLSAYDDDASCLNLNKVANPRILAVDPMLLEGRFMFVSGGKMLKKSSSEMLKNDSPWLTLVSKTDGIVPAIADQTVIQWGLGKKIGDTLTYKNFKGEKVKLVLVGGIANSVLQGNVIISQENFLKHFPSSGGTNFFLIDIPSAPSTPSTTSQLSTENQANIHGSLSSIFRDYGWAMDMTEVKLAEFNSVENTYLSIFFLMGAFGMLLGTLGFAVIIVKSMVERKKETALLRALGFERKTILRLYYLEYTLLFAAGLAAGTLSALIATLPTLISG